MNNSTEVHGLRFLKLPDRLSGARHPGGYDHDCCGRLGLTLEYPQSGVEEILNGERTEAQEIYLPSFAELRLGRGSDPVDFSIQRFEP